MINNIFKTITLAFTFVMCTGLVAQVTNEGHPSSWSLDNKKNTEAVVMPSLDMVSISAQDAISDMDKSNPYRFGFEMDVNLGIGNAGVWDVLPNGDRIWRINIFSEGANTLNFIFDEYKLPVGAKLYVYSDDRQSIIGAYTSVMNNSEEKLGTWMVDGDNIWIEYLEPANVIGQGKLNIGAVIHGYRSVTEASLMNRGLNDSGACNLDVDCSIGSDFDDKKDLLKHAVGLVAQGGYVCTGTLLNNTALDEEPYFIFANHCTFTPATSTFRFNWISPNPICASNGNSTSSGYNTTSGAELLATASQSDYRLFRLTGGLNDSWDLEWAGWNATDVVPDYSIGIHHPAGDIMKVCRNDVGLAQQTSGGQVFWAITSAGGGWEQGVTEGGSSGSGLFNPEGQLIGTLCCGGAACAGTNDNGQVDYYGRFATSYTNGGLAQWLDPTNSGVTSLNTLSEELLGVDVTDVLATSISVYPNPTSGIINIKVEGLDVANFDYEIYSVDGRKISNGSFTNTATISFENQSDGIYFIQLENTTTNALVTKKVIVRK
ncbi:lysyl endopeptidase precursor [unidentified eubacterium SCB49]|nr:lysyl endopeptidase precursor [unidentified eubacterium SCB49]